MGSRFIVLYLAVHLRWGGGTKICIYEQSEGKFPIHLLLPSDPRTENMEEGFAPQEAARHREPSHRFLICEMLV